MKAGIALGSNLDDRLENLRTARDEVARLGSNILCSRIYETEPVDCEPGAREFLNAAMEIEYAGPAESLLADLRAIERKLGRPSRRAKNISRTIDLDLLYFGDMQMDSPELKLPHPRLHLRRFVIEPLRDIRPDLILPGQTKSIARLFDDLPPKPRAAIFPEPL